MQKNIDDGAILTELGMSDSCRDTLSNLRNVLEGMTASGSTSMMSDDAAVGMVIEPDPVTSPDSGEQGVPTLSTAVVMAVQVCLHA
jgi:hypothetical protein